MFEKPSRQCISTKKRRRWWMDAPEKKYFHLFYKFIISISKYYLNLFLDWTIMLFIYFAFLLFSVFLFFFVLFLFYLIFILFIQDKISSVLLGLFLFLYQFVYRKAYVNLALVYVCLQFIYVWSFTLFHNCLLKDFRSTG